MGYVTPPQAGPATLPTTQLNAYKSALDFLGTSRPIFVGYQASAQTIPGSGGWTAINLDSELIDTDGGHSSAYPTSYGVFATSGWYQCCGQVNDTDTQTTNPKSVGVRINGGVSAGAAPDLLREDYEQAGAGLRQVSGLIHLNVGDFVELLVSQDTVSWTTGVSSNLAATSFLALIWMSA
jgi:hypothetical protein